MRSSASRAGSSDSRKARVLVDQAQADLVGHDLAVEQPVAGLGDRHRLGEQVVQLDDLDAVGTQLVDEVGVVALGLLHPHDVVEEQPSGVGRGEPPVGQPGAADEHLAQPSHLRVHPVGRRSLRRGPVHRQPLRVVRCGPAVAGAATDPTTGDPARPAPARRRQGPGVLGGGSGSVQGGPRETAGARTRHARRMTTTTTSRPRAAAAHPAPVAAAPGAGRDGGRAGPRGHRTRSRDRPGRRPRAQRSRRGAARRRAARAAPPSTSRPRCSSSPASTSSSAEGSTSWPATGPGRPPTPRCSAGSGTACCSRWRRPCCCGAGPRGPPASATTGTRPRWSSPRTSSSPGWHCGAHGSPRASSPWPSPPGAVRPWPSPRSPPPGRDWWRSSSRCSPRMPCSRWRCSRHGLRPARWPSWAARRQVAATGRTSAAGS